MNSDNLFLKLQFFQYVPHNQNKCLICNQTVSMQETNSQFEQEINQHLISFNHLKAQKEILDKTGFLKNEASINYECERQSCPLFEPQIARELNQIGLNLYFQNCLLKLDNILSKKQSTQKEYRIILKRFYNLLFQHKTNQISDEIIKKFLQNKEYRHDSISALKLLAKQAGYQISLEIENTIQIEKINQLKRNENKAQLDLIYCGQFLELLLKNLNYNLAFLLLLLFELDLKLSCISILTFQDVLSDKIEIHKQKCDQLRTKRVFIGKSLQQAAKITLKALGLHLNSPIIPLIKNYRDIQSLLEKLKKEYRFQLDGYNQETKKFIQNFHLSVIKFIKKSPPLENQVSSKTQYQSALMKLLKTIESKDLNNLCGFDLLKIMQDSCTILTQVNAVIRLQNTMNIPKSVEFKEKVKLQKKLIKEHVEKRPHRSWDLNYIQELLNELFVCNRGFLAFRLFILYELAARISELAQITFQMVVNGFINYIPKKQERLGNNAERRFQIIMSVQLQTKEFVKRNSLSLFQTLDIGLHKQTIKSQSFHKQLKYALKFIENGKVNHSNEYKEFLQNFQYHDLRYTKLQEMNKCGIDEKIIQQFVKHSNSKTIKLYLQNQNFLTAQNNIKKQQEMGMIIKSFSYSKLENKYLREIEKEGTVLDDSYQNELLSQFKKLNLLVYQ